MKNILKIKIFIIALFAILFFLTLNTKTFARSTDDEEVKATTPNGIEFAIMNPEILSHSNIVVTSYCEDDGTYARYYLAIGFTNNSGYFGLCSEISTPRGVKFGIQCYDSERQ